LGFGWHGHFPEKIESAVADTSFPAKEALRSFSKAGPSKRIRPMYYVYLLECISNPSRRYVGFTSDLRCRLSAHNDGKLPTTAPHRPWQLKTYLAFSSKKQALSFEKYLKSGSGNAFAQRRLWPSDG
jgi:putative endonuclease